VTARRRLAVAVAAAVLAGCRRTPPPDRILLIVVDTLRRDHVGVYGGAVPTPNMDAFAKGGTTFGNAVGAFHQTTMSMAALFTGRTPSLESEDADTALPWSGQTWCGLARLATARDAACVPANVPTLAESLRRAGYRTAGIVSNPLLFRPAGYDRGFDDWIELGRDVDARSGGPVIRAVQLWLTRRKTDHFFLYVHLMDVHDWAQRGTPYDDGVKKADGRVGEIEQLFAVARLTQGTTMIFTADHGEALGEVHPLPSSPQHIGNPSFEPVVRVPLMVWPHIDAGPDRLMRSDDTFRLIHRIAGLTPPPPVDLSPDEHFLTERYFRTYADGRWKSIWPRGRDAPSLFDLAADPDERSDVAAAHLDEIARHRARVAALSRQLATAAAAQAGPTREDVERLHALGYVE
jgi:arylsulfatase A-like enzyme